MEEGSWDRVHTSKVRVSSTGARAHKETRKKDTGDCERRAHKGCVGSKGVRAHSCVKTLGGSRMNTQGVWVSCGVNIVYV